MWYSHFFAEVVENTVKYRVPGTDTLQTIRQICVRNGLNRSSQSSFLGWLAVFLMITSGTRECRVPGTDTLTAVDVAGKAKDNSYKWLVYCDCNPGHQFPVTGGDLRRGRKVDCGCRHGNRAELLGEKFGKLLVVDFRYNMNTKKFRWICLCNCGETTPAKTVDLTSGSKKLSCGCLKSPNLVGKKFGRLTVTKKLTAKKHGYHLWRVLCDCGKYDKAITGHLTSGNKKSCGCLILEIEDITGERRNKLTAKKIADFRNSQDDVIWEFICDCGNPAFTTKDKFRSGHTKSCGCLKDLSLDKHPNWQGGVSQLYKFLRRSIKEWNQASLEATNYKCFISGEKGKREVHHANAQHTFHAIVKETIGLTGLPIYPKIGQYKTEELTQLSQICVELHYKYGLGVPLKPELHREFHYTYGFTDWTSEDFSEFVEQERKSYRF